MSAQSIPAFCPTCRAFFKTGMIVTQYGKLEVGVDGMRTDCPNGHIAYYLGGTYTIYNGLLKIAEYNPEILANIRDAAENGITGKTSPKEAISKIGVLAPSVSHAIKEQFGFHDSVALLNLLVSIIACVIAAIGVFNPNPPPQTIVINNDITIPNTTASEYHPDSSIPHPLTKEQVRKRKEMQRKKEKRKKKAQKKTNRVRGHRNIRFG
jgi:hypothetical protein